VKSLWATIQDNPVLFRRINGWLTVVWFIGAIPICLFLANSVPFLVFISVYAVVTGHLSTWQAANVEVRQEEESQKRDDEAPERIEKKVEQLNKQV
jgi:type VI protein secretion system component VasK